MFPIPQEKNSCNYCAVMCTQSKHSYTVLRRLLTLQTNGMSPKYPAPPAVTERNICGKAVFTLPRHVACHVTRTHTMCVCDTHTLSCYVVTRYKFMQARRLPGYTYRPASKSMGEIMRGTAGRLH